MVRGITNRATSIRRLTALAVGLGTLALASSALAEPRTHDGFYMHINAGLGYYSTTASVANVDAKYSGMTLPSSIFLGGTVGSGFAIAGGFFVDYAPSPKYEYNGQEVNVDFKQYLLGIGPLLDFYVNPNEGLHFQLFLGWGGLDTSSNGNNSGNDPTGLVTFVGGGYDWWVADEWSIGVMGRLTYAPLKYSAGGGQSVSYPTIAPALLATFTYH